MIMVGILVFCFIATLLVGIYIGLCLGARLGHWANEQRALELERAEKAYREATRLAYERHYNYLVDKEAKKNQTK